MRLIAVCLSLGLSGPAAAHGPQPLAPEALWFSWNFDPLLLLPLTITVWMYVRGARRLRRRPGGGRAIGQVHGLAFGAGVALLLFALVSPLEPLGGTLLSAHMAQHALLVAVAPPLLLAGKPGLVLLWGLPATWRRVVLRSVLWRALASLVDGLSRPLTAAALHALALWLWHAPAAFNAALASYELHFLEHVSFFATALFFWRAILTARAPWRAARALGAAFATLLHGGLLAALITLATHPLYVWYVGRAELWGWTPLEDQQLAGLLMWVPLGIVYLGACLWLAARLLGHAQRALSAADRS